VHVYEVARELRQRPPLTKLSPVMRPGEASIYHAWKPYQFPGWRGNMELVSSPYKPLHFAGD
jgi:hypothetical protein